MEFTVYDYVTIASQFLIVGAVFECIVILIGHVIFSVLDQLEGGI